MLLNEVERVPSSFCIKREEMDNSWRRGSNGNTERIVAKSIIHGFRPCRLNLVRAAGSKVAVLGVKYDVTERINIMSSSGQAGCRYRRTRSKSLPSKASLEWWGNNRNKTKKVNVLGFESKTTQGFRSYSHI